MNFTTVLLVCTAAIAGCAGLVFLVETVVAFWLGNDAENAPVVTSRMPLDAYGQAEAERRAA